MKGLRALKAPLPLPLECPVLPIKVPRWTLRPCTRLEMLRHTCDKTKPPGLERRSGPGGSRVPVRKPPPNWTPRLRIPSFSTTCGHLQAPPLGTGESEGKLGPMSTEERTGLWDPAEVATVGPGQQSQGACGVRGPAGGRIPPTVEAGSGQQVRPGRLVFSGAQRSVLRWGHCDRGWDRRETPRPGLSLPGPG